MYLIKLMSNMTITLSTAFFLSGCSLYTSPSWKTYQNERYGFEFPYPSNWQLSKNPDNSDGIAFFSPKNQSVEIRSWVSKKLDYIINNSPNYTYQNKNHNFQTLQGFPGILIIEVGEKETVMKLIIHQDQLEYSWQGKTKSQEFKDYYPMFYYIANEYKISK